MMAMINYAALEKDARTVGHADVPATKAAPTPTPAVPESSYNPNAGLKAWGFGEDVVYGPYWANTIDEAFDEFEDDIGPSEVYLEIIDPDAFSRAEERVARGEHWFPDGGMGNLYSDETYKQAVEMARAEYTNSSGRMFRRLRSFDGRRAEDITAVDWVLERARVRCAGTCTTPWDERWDDWLHVWDEPVFVDPQTEDIYCEECAYTIDLAAGGGSRFHHIIRDETENRRVWPYLVRLVALDEYLRQRKAPQQEM